MSARTLHVYPRPCRPARRAPFSALLSIAFAAVACGVSAHAQPVSPHAKPASERTPAEAMYVAAVDEDFARFDALVAQHSAADTRGKDGRAEIYVASRMIDDWYGALLDRAGGNLQEKYASVQGHHPQLVNVPILKAINLRMMAWHARGYGFASSVTPEGWRLFRQRSLSAWGVLQMYQGQGKRSPLWYQESIAAGLDAAVPLAQVRALHDEGLKRFPGYHGIYFNFARIYSPRWGGSYEAAEAYVREQVAAPTNRDGDMLYTRLYWVIDQYGGEDAGFFQESQVDWERMRRGFELMMARYPDSPRNLAYFVAYACRAGDGKTYARLRQVVDQGEFLQAAPHGLSLEVCDLRFLTQT